MVHAIRKLPHYFQTHTVYVLTEYPLQYLLKRSDFRIAKWGTRLGSFDIRYRPTSSIKGQVLADFVAEFSSRKEMEIVCHVKVRPWSVFVDGASSAMGVGARIVIITLEGIRVKCTLRLGFKASNNKAEYKALLAELRAVLDLGLQDMVVYLDSRLIVNQVEGSFEAKDPRMIDYLRLVKQTMSLFQQVKLIQIAWGQNRHADSLAT